MPFRALLIDDEAPARERFRRLLAAHTDTVTVVGEAANARDGLAALATENPDLLFLDIQMPGLDGFGLLQQAAPRPRVIFVTAFAEYAVRAFEENAVDYLLKPVEPARLAAALDRLGTAPDTGRLAPDQLDALIAQLRPAPAPTTLPVRLGDRFLFVPLADITYFEARDKYVYLHTTDGKEYLLDQSLAALAQKLPSAFVQVHRGYIVHRPHVREVQKFLGGRYRLRLAGLPAPTITTGPSYAAVVQELVAF